MSALRAILGSTLFGATVQLASGGDTARAVSAAVAFLAGFYFAGMGDDRRVAS